MKNQLSVLCLVVVLGGLAGCAELGKGAAGSGLAAREAQLVEQYDVIAVKIIENERQEIETMRSLLGVYLSQAEMAFEAAKGAEGDAQKADLKAGMEAIGKLAQEGDKRVDEIKNRLRKAGHHHTKADDDSGEEYILVNTKTKKALMAEAEKVRALMASGKAITAAELDAILQAVNSAVEPIIKPKK